MLQQLGVMQARVIEAASRYPDDAFLIPRKWSLHPSMTTYEERSARINQVLTQWREERLFVTLKCWANEVDASDDNQVSYHHFLISLVLRS